MTWKFAYPISLLFLICAAIYKDPAALTLGCFWMLLAQNDYTREKIKALEDKVNYWIRNSR